MEGLSKVRRKAEGNKLPRANPEYEMGICIVRALWIWKCMPKPIHSLLLLACTASAYKAKKSKAREWNAFLLVATVTTRKTHTYS